MYSRLTAPLGIGIFLLTILCFGYRSDAAEPKKVALLVGVNTYDKPGFAPLKFAESDVDALAAELKKHGFAVTVLKGSGKDKLRATRENIDRTIKHLVEPLSQNDLMLVALSGHGQELPSVRKVNDKDAFFCPVDAIREDPKKLFSLSYLTDDILAKNVGKKLVIVDACRDMPDDSSRGSKGIQGRMIALPEDTAVLFSCRSGQRSFEKAQVKHGLFTHCLLEGLRGEAARPGKTDISWQDLVAFVDSRMASDEIKTLLGAGQVQEPIAAGGVGRTIIGKNLAKATQKQSAPEATDPEENSETVILAFSEPYEMTVAWQLKGGAYTENPITTPKTKAFRAGTTYRLRFSNFPGRDSDNFKMVLLPKITVYPITVKTKQYLQSNSIPISLTDEDLDVIQNGAYLTKVYYRSDPMYRESAIAGVESLVTTRLDPGIDPVRESERRGAILAVLRIGSRDRIPPGTSRGSASYMIAVD